MTNRSIPLRPSHAVVGATDVDRLVSMFATFGFEARGRHELPAEVAGALYGLDGPSSEVSMAVPGAARGGIRIVATPHASHAPGHFDRRPFALDLYTRDIAQSVVAARDAGAPCGEVGEYAFGPLNVKEAKSVGPDHVVTVFIEVAKRRPSVFDTDPVRLHSEVHALVWLVNRVDEALPFWQDGAAMQVLLDATMRNEAVASLMGLPRPDTPIRLAILTEASAEPIRFELLEFPEDAGPELPTWPLRGGLHALGCEVDDLGAAMSAWPDVTFGTPVTVVRGSRRGRAVTALAPAGVRFELWEAR